MKNRSSSPPPVPLRFLRKSQIIPAIVSVSSATFDRWVRDGRFPPGRLVSRGVRIWSLDELTDWPPQGAPFDKRRKP